MALPKRAASAPTVAAEVQDQRHQAHAQEKPRREEAHDDVKPQVRDGGLAERHKEEEEPQANGDEGGDQAGAAGTFFGGAVHGGVPLADVASPGPEFIEAPTSVPVPPPLSVGFCVRREK